MSSDTKGFKVVDRRAFTPEGELRDGVIIEDDVQPAGQKQPESIHEGEPDQGMASSGIPRLNSGHEVEPPDTDISFMGFVQSLAQQALMQLGLIPGPGGQPMADLDRARDTIDILSLVQFKSQDRMDDEEFELFQGLLLELRMAYVEVTKRIAQNATSHEHE